MDKYDVKLRERKMIMFELRQLKQTVSNRHINHKYKCYLFVEISCFIRGMLMSPTVTINTYNLVNKYIDTIQKEYHLYFNVYFDR